jgi:tetratricopeptide (TPR) repeat protein
LTGTGECFDTARAFFIEAMQNDSISEAQALERAARPAEAEAIYRRLVTQDPASHAAWHALGVLAAGKQQLEAAADMLKAAVSLDKQNAMYQRNFGEVCRRLGRLDDAIYAGRQACKYAPDNADAQYNLALAFGDKQDAEQSTKHYRKALSLNPMHAQAWNNLGTVLERQQDLNGAEEAYQQAVRMNATNAEAQHNLGMVYLKQDKIARARSCFHAALAAQPDFQPARIRLEQINQNRPASEIEAEKLHAQGGGQYREDDFTAAENSYRQALALHPTFSEAWNSLGFVLQDMGKLQEALTCFEKSVELNPDFTIGRLNLAFAQLKAGDFTKGWENYEARWTGSAEAVKGGLQRPSVPLPQWTGQEPAPTEGKRLLVVSEQGYGDVFQFSRLLAQAKQHFAKVGFVCSQPVLRLMDWSYGDDVFLMNHLPNNPADWDMQCPMMSLPRALSLRLESVPATTPYLKVQPSASKHWKDKLDIAAPKGLRIGLAWTGRKKHQYNNRRSLTLEMMAPLFKIKPITWVSLQKWTEGEKAPDLPPGVAWIDWTADETDFGDAAAIISQLDLVLTIDSSMSHLAGALNIPVWLMDRFDNEWRWLDQRTDSPWYPSMRIFRQSAFGDWASVVTEVTQALKTLSTHHPNKG